MDRSPSQDQDDDASSRFADDRSGLLIGGKYRVLKLIGHGSTGAVYVSRHEGLDKLVALKILHREMEQNEGFVERFKMEAQAASRLEHPNSVRVLDFGRDAAGALYIAMEYVEGRDLLQVLDEDGAFTPERAVDVISQILDVLSVAHSIGIVHRDLKPENILVRPVQIDGVTCELVTVCDFGIAQLANGRRSGSNDEVLVAGTPAYMSPEQARAQLQDARSDLYSVGVVLYQLLTHHLPFVSEDAHALARAHCIELPPPPSKHRADLSPELENICLKALAKKKEDRFQSAREMRAALVAAIGPKGVDFALETTQVGIPRWSVLPRTVSSITGIPGVAVPPLGLSQGSQTPLTAQVAATERNGVFRDRPRWLLPVATGVAALVIAFGVGTARNRHRTGESARGGRDHLVQPSATRSAAARPSSEAAATADADALLSEAATGRLRAASEPLESLSESGESDLAGVSPVPRGATVPAITPRVSAQLEAEPGRAKPLAADGLLAKRSVAPEAAPAKNDKPSAALHAEPEKRVAVPPEADKRVPVPEIEKPSAAAPEPEKRAPSVEASPVRAEAQPKLVPAPEAKSPTVIEAPAEPTHRETWVAAAMDGSNESQLQPRAAAPAARKVPTPAAEPVVVDDARVTISGVASRSAVSKGSLRGALNMSAVTECYRSALREGAVGARAFSAQIALTASMSGGVTEASMPSTNVPQSLRHCVEQVARRGRVRDADTGEANASFTLIFEPR